MVPIYAQSYHWKIKLLYFVNRVCVGTFCISEKWISNECLLCLGTLHWNENGIECINVAVVPPLNNNCIEIGFSENTIKLIKYSVVIYLYLIIVIVTCISKHGTAQAHIITSLERINQFRITPNYNFLLYRSLPIRINLAYYHSLYCHWLLSDAYCL